MTDSTITIPQSDHDLLSVIREVVTEAGEDFKYPHTMCTYLDGGGTGCRCLVGRVFTKLGVPDSTLAEFDSASDDDGLSADAAAKQLGLPPSQAQLLILTQMDNDQQMQWGTILHNAEKYLAYGHYPGHPAL